MFDPKERVSLNEIFVEGLIANGLYVNGPFVDGFFNPTNRSFDLKTNNDLHQPE